MGIRLHFGSYHDVDSSELAFKLAASIAFKEGFKKAKPVLLEPIMKVRNLKLLALRSTLKYRCLKCSDTQLSCVL